MGLQDLGKQKKMEHKMDRREDIAEQEDQSTFDELPLKDENGEYISEGRKPGIGSDFNKEEKPCHKCMYISKKAEGKHRFYACPNPDCGILEFQLGWNEWRTPNQFLSDVEVEGYRYNE